MGVSYPHELLDRDKVEERAKKRWPSATIHLSQVRPSHEGRRCLLVVSTANGEQVKVGGRTWSRVARRAGLAT